MVLNRSAIQRPELLQRTVDVPALGGEVVVQMLLLSDHLFLLRTDEHKRTAETLARAVRDNEGEPIFTAAEWEIFGAKNSGASRLLMDTIRELSTVDEKNVTAPS